MWRGQFQVLSEIKWGIEIRQSESDTWRGQQKNGAKKGRDKMTKKT